MLRSSRIRLLTASLCAAGLFTGQFLLGQQPLQQPASSTSSNNLGTPSNNLLPPIVKKPQLQRVALEAAPVELEKSVATDALAPILSAKDMPRPQRNKPSTTAQAPAAVVQKPLIEKPVVEKPLPLEAILAKPVENKVAPASATDVALPSGKPATTGPWMQDIREMIRSTPGPNGAVRTATAKPADNKNVAKQVQYEKPEALPAGPPQELIATPLGGAQSAFPSAAPVAIPAPPVEAPALAPPPAFNAPAFTPAVPEVKEQPAPATYPVTQLQPPAPAPQPKPVELTPPQPAPQPQAVVATAPSKPKSKLPHLAPMNPAYEAAAQARGIAQVKAENSLPPFSPQQYNNGQLTPVQTYEPVAPSRLNQQQVNLLTQQPAQPPMAIPPPPLAPTPQAPMIDPVADAMRRSGSPFEIIDETGAVQVMVRRSKLLRTKVDIYRTAVVDDSICEIVQFTPREVSLIGKSQGSTHVTFWFDDPNMQPVTYVIQVVPDVAEVQKVENNYKMLQDVINEMFPDSKIQLMIVADKLILRGQAKDSEEAAQIVALVRSQTGGWSPGAGAGGMGGGLSEGSAAQVLSDSATGSSQRSRLQVINMIRVPGVQQVALRVKIAEMNRSAARGFGIDVKGNVNFTDNPDGSQLFLQSMLNVAAGAGPALLTQVDGDDIQIGVRYLQSHGVLRLLSEPTLVTMSGTPATFIAGGEFAVPTLVGSAGLNAVTTDFRAFGAIISFMPTVIDKDRIRLQVSPEFSQINSALTVNNTPGLKVRAATTTVEMREGQTLAIAGLLEDNMNGTNAGDLPFLAKVFGRREMNRNETELLILVAPELVHAMEAEEVPPLPGFDITEPTSAQFFLHGRLEGNPTQDYRSTVWPRLKKRYGAGGPAMTSGPFGHGQ
jgi:pilus assembly protein CpaC